MQIKEIAFFILSLSVAITAVNSIGIFSPVEELGTNEVNQTLTEGVSAINDSMISSNAAADAVSGTSLLLQAWATFKTMLTLTLLPGVWLFGIGVPLYMCVPVQAMVNATEIWGVLQFTTGRSTRQMD